MSDHEIPADAEGPAGSEDYDSAQAYLSVSRALEPYAAIIRENNELLSRSLSLAVGESATKLRSALASLSAVQVQRLYGPLFPPFNLMEAIRRPLLPPLPQIHLAVPASMPPNWPDQPPIDLGAAVTVVNDGIPLVWVPRPEIVTELVSAADESARDAILAKRLAEISADCQAALDEVARPDLKALAGLASEAARSLGHGCSAPAQALAANVFDTWLREVNRRGTILTPAPSGWAGYRRIRGQIDPVGDDTLMREFRRACVLAPALPALAPFLPGDPVPGTWNRHATAHSAGPVQYTDANAAAAVMLATSVIRESDESGW